MSSRILTVPNMLTVFRMVLIPVFVTLLFYQRFVLALAVFVLAGLLTDSTACWLDVLTSSPNSALSSIRLPTS